MFVSSPRVSVHTEPIDTWVLVIRFSPRYRFLLLLLIIVVIIVIIVIVIIISDLKAEDEGTYYCHLGADPAIKMPVHLLVDGDHHPQPLHHYHHRHHGYRLYLSYP